MPGSGLFLTVAVLAASTVAPAPARVEVELSVPAQEKVELAAGTAKVKLRRMQQEGLIEAESSIPGTTRFSVTMGETLELRVEAPGFWAPSRIVQVEEPSMLVALDLRPTAIVVAQAAVPQGHSIPEKLEVRFESAPDAPKPLDGEHSVRCPLTDGQLQCEIPAGSLDLHFRAPGFITIHRWGTDLHPHREKKLAALVLRPGASIVGRVEASGEDFDPQAVEVELVTTRGGLALDDVRRPGALDRKVRANVRGFYELTDVPPGSYTVVTRHPGYAPGRLKTVVVQEGVEVELRTLELGRPRSLEAHLAPPTDPFGRPWRLKLLQSGGLPNTWADAGEGTTDEQGVVRLSDLIPTMHRLQVLDRRGAVWHTAMIELLEPTTLLKVELPFERLEARVTLAGEPLEARVIFRGIEDGKAIARDSDEDGKVYVFLPEREEPWTVDVESEQPKVRARVEGVRVEKKPGDPWAKAEIEVPDTQVFGVVMDEQGRPLPGALVSIAGPEPRASEQVQATGSNAQFELRGYPAGLWKLEASYWENPDEPSLSAPLTEILVMEEVPAGPVRLIARREQILRGQVVSPDGVGIPGTLVVAGLEQPERLTRSIQHRAAGLDGRFTLRLPAGTPAVQLQVFPPGFTAHQVRVALPRTEPLVLPAETDGGTLIVRWTDVERATESLKSKLLLFGEFVYYNPFLDMWAGMHEMAGERRLVVPNLEPGTYSACLDLDASVMDTGRLPLGLEGRCVSGNLSPLGELVLEIPVPAASPESAAPAE